MSYHSAYHRQPVASHMFPRLRYFFCQHHKWAALYQFAFRYPTRQVFMPAQTTWQWQPAAADVRQIVIQLFAHIRTNTRDMNMKMVLRTPGAGVDRQRNRAIGTGWPYFLLIKSRACQANQKKFGVEGSVNKGLSVPLIRYVGINRYCSGPLRSFKTTYPALGLTSAHGEGFLILLLIGQTFLKDNLT
ncbi:Uncharacterised protein [Escherichia coli]|nr:Uncharacterised protein [Escherichia coli]